MFTNPFYIVYNLKMHPWVKAYKEKKFSIHTLSPSIVISNNIHLLKKNGVALDIGCGNGRNSIFLAQHEYTVESIDVADLNWRKDIPPTLKEHITFKKTSIEDFVWKESYYDVVVLTRVIQYISQKEVEKLIKNIVHSLTNEGVLLLSYNESGGIHTIQDIAVPKFSHPISTVQNILETYFNYVDITKGSSISKHVNYVKEIVSYDIVAKDLK